VLKTSGEASRKRRSSLGWLLGSAVAFPNLPKRSAAYPQSQAGTVYGGALQTIEGRGSSPVFVLNSRDATVSLIDPGSLRVAGEFPVGKEPHHLYPTPDGSQLIVGSAMSNELHIFDPLSARLLQRVRRIDDPYQIGYAPNQRWFAVAALRLDRVDLYAHSGLPGEPFQLLKRIALPKAPSHLWFTADSKTLLVTLQDSGELAAIDMERMETHWKLAVGALAAGVIVTADDRLALVGVMGEDYVAVVDWRQRQIVQRLTTGKGAHNFRGAGDRRHIYVSNRVENTIACVDTVSWRVTGSLSVPGGPDCMEISSDLRTMWVTSRFARAVHVVDLPSAKILHRIQVGRSPHGIFTAQRAPQL
jgi:DNA-binding beta-propeller fold protein YncE